jgi:hypothetical protein
VLRPGIKPITDPKVRGPLPNCSARSRMGWNPTSGTSTANPAGGGKPICHRMAASITALRFAGSLRSPAFRGFDYAWSEGEGLIIVWSRDRRQS